MESLSITTIITKLNSKEIPLFGLSELGNVLGIENRQTLYKRIARLEKKLILRKLSKGKYQYLLKDANDFTLANFLYQPSYISLQSALSFYSILTGFPYQTTSISIKKSKKIEIDEKIYAYSTIDNKLFWGWEKINDFLIARPEKALLDYIYFASKGILTIDWDEIDTSKIDKELFHVWAKKYDYTRSDFKFI